MARRPGITPTQARELARLCRAVGEPYRGNGMRQAAAAREIKRLQELERIAARRPKPRAAPREPKLGELLQQALRRGADAAALEERIDRLLFGQPWEPGV